MLVSLVGKYTPKNFLILFEAAQKTKVTLTDVQHVQGGVNFAMSAHIDGTWASQPAFLKKLNQLVAKGEEIHSLNTTYDYEPNTIPGDEVDVYTQYTVSVEIPEPNNNGIHDIVKYLVKAGCTVHKVQLRTHRTYLTNTLVSSGTIEIAVPGTYKQAQVVLEELALVAESSDIVIGLNLNIN